MKKKKTVADEIKQQSADILQEIERLNGGTQQGGVK